MINGGMEWDDCHAMHGHPKRKNQVCVEKLYVKRDTDLECVFGTFFVKFTRLLDMAAN